MLRLTTDPKQIERVLYAPCPMQSTGIRMKMRALYRAYGLQYPFCSYYISEDELNEENIIPTALDKRVAKVVAEAVMDTARKTGVARI